MKRLTINQIARAGLRSGWRGYISLAVGIFLSIFLITGLFLAGQGVLLAQRERLALRLGYEDMFTLDSDQTDEYFMESGFFEEIGHVYVNACVQDTPKYVGWYDETAARMLRRRLAQGRMPEGPGEIVLERSVLELTRREAEVGDEISLSLVPVNGAAEERTFTLVGILEEQTAFLDVSGHFMTTEDRVLQFPALLVHPDEPALQTGRVAAHKLMTLKRGATLHAAMLYWMERSTIVFGINSGGEVSSWAPEPFYELLRGDAGVVLIMLAILAASLVFAAGAGIAQAMEGQLSRKLDEIGMLRAVGATRRQIRRIFGREAWLLALVLAPLSVGLSCLAVWAAANLMPEALIFRAEERLLIPVAVLSAIAIYLSARLPLRRASRTMPMAAIRDTALLRKAKRIRGKKRFSAPSLISGRQLLLHPTRQIGAILLVALMLLCVGLGSDVGALTLDMVGAKDEPVFSIYESGNSFLMVPLVDRLPQHTFGDQDILQLQTLPRVKKVEVGKRLTVNLLLDGPVPAYLMSPAFDWHEGIGDHIDRETGLANEGSAAWAAAREIFGLNGRQAIDMDVTLLEEDEIYALRENLADGKIDMDALNAGTQVIVWAPDVYVYTRPDGHGGEYETHAYREDSRLKAVSRHINDYFSAGQSLSIMQLMLPEAEEMDEDYWYDFGEEAFYRKNYGLCQRHDAQVTVGAVFKGGLALARYIPPGFITTLKGARAMGLETGVKPDYIEICVDGELSPDEEEYLERRVEAIAMRAPRFSVRNYLESERESARTQRGVALVMLGVAVVFCATAVGIIAGGVTRRVRADRRMIGTIRAVGADRKTVRRCYMGQIILSVGAGAILGGAAYAILMAATTIHRAFAWVAPLAMLVFAAVCFLSCRGMLTLSLRDTLSHSIVENIREL